MDISCYIKKEAKDIIIGMILFGIDGDWALSFLEAYFGEDYIWEIPI